MEYYDDNVMMKLQGLLGFSEEDLDHYQCLNNYYYNRSPSFLQVEEHLPHPDSGIINQLLDEYQNALLLLLQNPDATPQGPVLSDSGSRKKKKNNNKTTTTGGSKNLMAERRRRKRLNDRLSMLRSIVPNITKMDRTSILSDTIDYIKHLLHKINTLQQHALMQPPPLLRDANPNQVLLRTSPQFEVERRHWDTRVEVWCGGAKPGLLLSTLTTMEALGLDIQHTVISCFHDFALHASCSEELGKRGMLDAEDIKQALLRNAGYGGN